MEKRVPLRYSFENSSARHSAGKSVSQTHQQFWTLWATKTPTAHDSFIWTIILQINLAGGFQPCRICCSTAQDKNLISPQRLDKSLRVQAEKHEFSKCYNEFLVKPVKYAGAYVIKNVHINVWAMRISAVSSITQLELLKIIKKKGKTLENVTTYYFCH